MNLTWSKIEFCLILIFLSFFPLQAFSEEKVLITYEEEHLIGNENLIKMINNLLMHFKFSIDVIDFNSLDVKNLKNYRYIFIPIIGKLPDKLKREIDTLKDTKICFLGKVTNLEQIKYFKEQKEFIRIDYKLETFYISPKNLVYTYTKNNKNNIITLATVSDGVHNIPILLKSKNIFLLGIFPLWEKGAYFFANFLYDFFDINSKMDPPKATIILQDINPYTKPKNLLNTINLLNQEKIPFSISYYPLYYDVDRKKFTPIKRSKTISLMLNTLFEQNNVTFILSGLCRQYYKERNEKDAEFWDIKYDRPINNFPQYFEERINMAFTLSRDIGITPIGFMPSEFAFPPKYMNLIGKYFDYYIGTIQLSNHTYKATQSLPYIIYNPKLDLYIVSPNLGYVNKEYPIESISNIIERAKKLKSVNGAYGVIYFHPFIDTKYLKEIIDQLRVLGYEFSNLPFEEKELKKLKNIKYIKKINYNKIVLKKEGIKVKKVAKITGKLLFTLSALLVILGFFLYFIISKRNYKTLFKIIFLTFMINISLLTFAYSKESKEAVVIAERSEDMVMLSNLLGHFKLNIYSYTTPKIDTSIAEKADILFFISNNDNKIPKEILDIFKNRKKDNCFIGTDIRVLVKSNTYNSFEFIETSHNYPYIVYKDYTLFNSIDPFVPVIKLKEGKVYGHFSNLKDKIPLIAKTKNLWIVLGDPFYGLTSIVFSDVLHDIIEENHTSIPKALIRIEDINPGYDIKTLDETISYLKKNHLPFAMAFYPIFMNFNLKKSITLEHTPKMVKYLKNLDRYGGRIIMHGITHQYKKNMISGEGSEFWDITKDAPITNFKEFFNTRISYGIGLFKRLSIPFYAFEPPHYNLSLEGQSELRKFIPNYVGKIMVNNISFKKTQEFYYPIYKSYPGLYIIPENLGYVNKDNKMESIEHILFKAKVIKKWIRDPFVGFFFHPFLGVEYIKPIIKGLKESGYYFVDLKKEVPPLILPKVRELKLEDLNLPFYNKEKKGIINILFLLSLASIILLFIIYNKNKNKGKYK